MENEKEIKEYTIKVELVPGIDEIEKGEPMYEMNILSIKNEKGEEIQYHENETLNLNSSSTKLHHSSCCCWRLVSGKLRCNSRYC